MGDLQVVRWTRYGKDRLYIKDAEGRDIGWVDAVTGHVTTQWPEMIESIALVARDNGVAAVTISPQPHSSGTAASSPTPPAPAVDAPTPQGGAPIDPAPGLDADQLEGPVEPSWHDLALNRPGQAARARAEQERAAMMERSRLGTWLARAVDAKTDERAWRVGAEGEETIGSKLEKLTKRGWHVLHAVPVGTRGSDIDHVLIGPGGVFTVNTKKHPGKKVWVGGDTLMVDGRRVPYIRNSEYEADRAERALTAAAGFPVLVKPVLVFTTGTVFPDVTIKKPPTRVVVLDRMAVPGVFARSPLRLEPDEVGAVYEAARKSTTWIR